MHFKSIAMLIKKSRLQSKLSQTKLSHKLGYLNGQFISNIERELCGLPANKIKLTSQVLNIEIEDIQLALIEDYISHIKNSVKE